MRTKIFDDMHINLSLYYDNIEEKWYLETHNSGEIRDLSGNTMNSFFRIFELDPDYFFSSVKIETQKQMLPTEIISELPFVNAINLLIDNKMFYWVQKANNWFKYLKFNENFRIKLSHLVYDNSFPQEMRHFWKKYLSSEK